MTPKRVESYLDGLDEDLKRSLREQLHLLWTYTSTALEGNSLTLGETQQVLTEGLTISGKPLKDHNEVMGHARAIVLVEKMIRKPKILSSDLFILHKAIQTEVVTDAHAPVGQWKTEPNSSVVVLDEKQRTNDSYALPEDVPTLMKAWLEDLNKRMSAKSRAQDPVETFAQVHAGFVRIHPFADGNGRMARLIANIPLIRGGHPPLVIQKSHRMEYIRSLARWQLKIRRPSPGKILVPENPDYRRYLNLLKKEWTVVMALVEEHRELQSDRP